MAAEEPRALGGEARWVMVACRALLRLVASRTGSWEATFTILHAGVRSDLTGFHRVAESAKLARWCCLCTFPNASVLDGMMTERVVGDYRLLRQLGQGAAGEVYLATPIADKPFARAGDPLALKLYKPEIMLEPKQAQRIKREFKVGSSLAHPNLIRIHEFVESTSDGRPYLVMEYVDGVTLDEWLRMFYPVSGRLLLRVADQLVAGLEELHANRIVHRDLKPSNVMLSSSFDLKIMDYGVVRITTDSPITPEERFLGTVRNSSPELLLGKEFDARTDLYSLGTILYALLYGEQVFGHETQRGRLQELILHAKPDFPPHAARDQISGALVSLAKVLLEKEPEARPNSIATVRERLSATRDLMGPEEAAQAPMHGYIATALTGLEDDAREHVMLLSGKIAEVAKQHDLYVYEPRKTTDPHEHPDVDATAVYDLDRKRVVDADLVLILANKPSFGVGQELEIAASYGKPVLLIYPDGTKISRMVRGSHANFMEEIAYRSPEDLEKQLHKSLSRVLTRVRAWKASSPQSSSRMDIGARIAELRMRAGHDSATALAAELGLPGRLVEAIEGGRLENIGVQLLHRICVAIGVSVNDVVAESTPHERQARQDANLQRLEELARTRGWPTGEYLDLRQDYRKQVAAKGESEVLSDKQWLARRYALQQRSLEEEEAPSPQERNDQPDLL